MFEELKIEQNTAEVILIGKKKLQKRLLSLDFGLHTP